MLYSLAALALAGVAAAIPATSATSAPPASPSCMTSYSGTFEIQVINVTTITTKRDLEKRAALMLTLKDGVLTDALGRIGYIAANSQFQFDYAAQPGSPYNAGWAVCSNSSLTLGPYATFQECLSGDFYNLYLNNPAGQCSDVYIDVIGGNTGAVSQQSDGQPTASSALPVTQISDGQPQLSTAIPVTQISDGQIQISTAVPVSQISDGQPQVPTSMAAPISQLSDGQPQAPLSTAAPVTQLSDGQPQAPLSTVTPVSQISDGQPQVPTNGTVIASPTATVVPFTGAAAMPTVARGELFGLAAGVLAIAML